ncbi:hypothetical protein D3C73_1233550 [compost metagenome]
MDHAPQQRSALLDAVLALEMLRKYFKARTTGCFQYADVVVELEQATVFELDQPRPSLAEKST